MGKKYDLIIIDNLLPVYKSPWRNCEYEGLIKEFNATKVIADLSSYYNYQDHLTYNDNLNELRKLYPLLADKVTRLKLGTSINTKFFYTLFYSNIKRYYKILQKRKISYGFTLYPGGGFAVNNEQIDDDLLKIINNEYCKFVFVNQSYTYNYLIEKLRINPEKIHLFIGGPLTFNTSQSQVQNKFENGITNVVFMATKYMPFGLDKGFDVFQNLILELKERNDIHFHVVGNFTKIDLLYQEIEEKITFHGYLNEKDFSQFFSNKDVIISPNRPNTLANGAFDGFPLATSVSGSIFGCTMMLTNELNESPDVFIDGLHYVKISPNHKDIANKLLYIILNKDKAKKIAYNGKNKMLEIFDPNKHLELRLNVIKQYL